MPALSLHARSIAHLRLSYDPIAITLAGGLLLAFSGCGGNNTSPKETASVTTVTVEGAAQTRIGGTAQFTATVTGGTSTEVTWQVNGVTNGSVATGTISASGLIPPPYPAFAQYRHHCCRQRRGNGSGHAGRNDPQPNPYNQLGHCDSERHHQHHLQH